MANRPSWPGRLQSGDVLLQQPVLDGDVGREVESGGQLAAFEPAVARVLAVQAGREFALDLEQELMQFAIVGIAQVDLGQGDHPVLDSNEFKNS